LESELGWEFEWEFEEDGEDASKTLRVFSSNTGTVLRFCGCGFGCAGADSVCTWSWGRGCDGTSSKEDVLPDSVNQACERMSRTPGLCDGSVRRIREMRSAASVASLVGYNGYMRGHTRADP
jgi:hypothetical protein